MTRPIFLRLMLLFPVLLLVLNLAYSPLLPGLGDNHTADGIHPQEEAPAGTAPGLNIKLPVRVTRAITPVTPTIPGSGGTPITYVEDLQKENFTVLINGQATPVLDFAMRKRSLAASPESTASTAGRQLLLSFDASDYPGIPAAAVNYVVHHILAPSDRLWVRSPLHTYQIDPQFAKEEITNYIETVLQTDFRQWKESKTQSLENLNLTMAALEKKLDGKRVGMNSILLFINTYTYQWRKFDKEFLLSGLEQYPELVSFAAQKPGDTWAIHFQERDLLPMLNRYRRLASRLKTHIDKLPKNIAENVALIRSSLDKIEKSMLFADEFPLQELADVFLGANIEYNAVFFSSRNQEETTGETVSVIPGYEQILRTLSHQTGGLTLELDTGTPDPAAELDTVTRHVDVYYELAFGVGTEPGDKQIEIRVNPAGTETYYKRKFKKEELTWLKQWVEQELSLDGVTLEGRQLSFTVSGFSMNQNAGTQSGKGLVKIEIRVIDDTNTVVYGTANTLQPVEKTIKISLPLPEKIKGYYKLSITVRDLAGGKNREVNKYVKIN